MAPNLVCMQVGDAGGAAIVRWDEAEELASTILTEPGVVVGANTAYDMAVLGQQFPALLPTIFAKYDRDEMTDVQNGKPSYYSLANLAKRLLGIELSKGKDTWRMRYAELRDIPVEQWPAEAIDYAAGDVFITARVYEAQSPHPDEFRQARASFWLHLMSCWGLTTDPDAVKRFADKARRDYDALVGELVAAGLMRDDGSRDTKAAMVRMEAAGSTARTATGRIALDDAACQASGDPLLVKYGEVSSLSKVLSTDVPLVRQGLIHARFESLLETGRVSSSPNIMNMPRRQGIRECYVPRAGHYFVGADYSTMELRTLAQTCFTFFGHSKLREALNDGRDPHLEMAAVILGISYDEARTRKKAPDVDNARQVSKVANFGFPGGLGPKRLVHFAKLSYDVTLTEAQARRLKQQWLQAWPEMKEYFALVNTSGDRSESLFSGRVRGGVSYCEGCNSLFQALAADGAKASGWLIAKACYIDTDSILFNSRPVLFCHDEFLLESPIDIANECALELARLMQMGAAPWLPDCPPVVGAPVVARRYSKHMQPVYDESGKLIPWDVAKS